MLKEKTVHELKQMIDEGSDFQLIDVREPHEFELANIGGEPIPMGKIMYERLTTPLSYQQKGKANDQ